MKVAAWLISRDMRLNLRIFLLILVVAMFAACQSSTSQKGGGGILSLDETEKAGNIVLEANKVFLQIKKRFKDNEPRLEELQQALKDKNPEKVRAISDALVTEINSGSKEAEEAIEKLKTAKELNINDDYRNYLDLKITALEKYIVAFEERRQAAILLRDGYDPKNAAKRDLVVGAFKQREDKFREIMDEAREISAEANDLAAESLKREKRGK